MASLGTLPPELLSIIFKQLSSRDLKQLGETCSSLYAAATAEEQFRLRVPELHHEKGIHLWSAAYRRFRALRRGPHRMVSFGRSDNGIRKRSIIGVAGDRNLVVFDEEVGRVVGFPTGWVAHVGLGMMSRCIMVGSARLAIIHGSGDRVDALECIDLATGHSVSHTTVNSNPKIVVSPAFCRGRIRREQVALSAGVDGDHLIFANKGNLSVVRLVDGCVVRRERTISETFSVLVRGVDGGWWGGDGDGLARVVGIVHHDNDNYIITNIVDGSEMGRFRAGGDEVVDVVIAPGTRIAWRAVRQGHQARAIICMRSCSGKSVESETRCDIGISTSAFRTASCELSLARGGHEVRVLPMGGRTVGDTTADGRICRVWCGKDHERIDTLNGLRRIRCVAFDWAAISDDGHIAMVCSKPLGIFSIFELSQGRCITSMQFGEPVAEIILVGQHWVVAMGVSGIAYEWHFSTYCNIQSDEGAYDLLPKFCKHFAKCETLLSRWSSSFKTLEIIQF